MNTDIFEKYKRQIILSYEHEYDFLQEDTFKRVYQENYHKLSAQKDRDDFRDYCFSDEKFRKYYKICYGEERFNKIDVLVNERKNNCILEEKDNSETNDDDWDFSDWNDVSDSDNENYDDEKINEEENLKKQKEEQLNKKIENYKKSFSTKFNGIEEFLDINKDLLIDKITSSIRKHSSTDLKEYLREYSLNVKGSEIKSKYDKAMATNTCAAFIVEILDGLKNIFDDDETALKHIDKCSRSLDQLSYEKAKLAETLKTEEKEADSFEDDEFDFASWDDDDTENNTQNSKTKLTEKEKKFEQLKKEILSASDINKALRFTLSNMPKEDWKDFNAYLLKDKNFRDSLNNQNPDKKEKQTNQRTTNKNENIFDFANDNESYSDNLEEDDDNVLTDEKNQQVNGMRNALYRHFDNETFNDINAEQLIDTITDLLLQEQIEEIEQSLEDILIKGRPEKKLESLQSALKYRHAYIVISTTCENIGKILNNYKINKLNRKINNHYDKYHDENGKLIEATINKIKTKQNLQKTGLFLGKVLLAPLKATAKIIEMSDEYAQRPEVQERRRQESIRYYCKFCGKEFKDPKSAAYNPCVIKTRYDKALANLEGGVPPSHHYCQLYEGTQKSEYRCKRCGKTEKTIASLVLSGPCHPIHIVNIDKYNTHGGTSDTAAISLHEPAL